MKDWTWTFWALLMCQTLLWAYIGIFLKAFMRLYYLVQVTLCDWIQGLPFFYRSYSSLCCWSNYSFGDWTLVGDCHWGVGPLDYFLFGGTLKYLPWYSHMLLLSLTFRFTLGNGPHMFSCTHLWWLPFGYGHLWCLDLEYILAFVDTHSWYWTLWALIAISPYLDLTNRPVIHLGLVLRSTFQCVVHGKCTWWNLTQYNFLFI